MSKLLSDRPLDPSSGQDRLGFRSVGERLADAIANPSHTEGLVIGVEGAWGSGKSSLIALSVDALTKLEIDKRPAIVDFRPWLVGSRDALLAALFIDLQRAIAKITLGCNGDATHSTLIAANEAGEKLRQFAERLAPVGSLVALAGAIHPAFSFIGKLISSGAKAAKEAKKSPSLPDLKRALDNALTALPVRIVVVIDDVDRLEPQEIIELLRLVRSVADFRNVVYVLCYDPDILTQAIEVGANIKDGRAYLEKIVQVSVPVPRPQAFLLRRWFESALKPNFHPLSDDAAQRLAHAIDTEGGRRLTTPRSVVRTLNAVSFSWTALKGQVDEADLVWLQLIRTDSPTLYRWIESYVTSMCVTRGVHVSIGADSQSADLDRLRQINKSSDITDDTLISEMSLYLPGISPGQDMPLFHKVHDSGWHNSRGKKRLSSPDHYRLYFALELPPLAITKAEEDAYIQSASISPKDLEEILVASLTETDGTGFTKADAILDSLVAGGHESLSPHGARNLLTAFANMMDAAAELSVHDSWLGATQWRQADKLMPLLLLKIGPDNRDEFLSELFRSGRAIGWLTSLFRREYFAHERYGNRPKPKNEWLLTDAELDVVTAVMVDRYERIGIAGLKDTFQPANAIFAWVQADAVSFELARENTIQSDLGFLTLLSMLASRVSSTSGDYEHISRSNLDILGLAEEDILNRVNNLSKGDTGLVTSLAIKVRGLLEADKGW